MLWYIDDFVFHKFILLIFQVSGVTTGIVKELLFINKIHFFYCSFKKCRNFQTLTLTDISNNITKQYYGIIKTFNVLIMVKKKQLSRTNIFIQNRSSPLVSKLSLISRTYLWCPLAKIGYYCKMWCVARISTMCTI